ncbi:zf-HC2 domain-containing protein [Conexibacter woesei]|uniref:zf-HC2 domain-containing protein n=1 Tax=Conexibacter woesei TaxID=191495 RepID=UPI0012DD5F5D|nr:zf-HC2 domain-containing protein [Conexibacter woesei]
MEGSGNGGVTPEGVRAGDRMALQGLVDRRGPAVIAFCTQVCGPQNADRAAAEAFARFRAAVRAAPDLGALDPETLLRGATRHAAASLARQPSGPPPHGRLRSRGTQTCEHVPTMLAARANGALGSADLDRLARHLERCERCDALGEIFRRAELAYQDPVVDTLGTDTSSVLLDALLAVPGDPYAVAPAPAAGAAAPAEVLTGAFPALPDLDDEVPVEVAPPVVVPEPEPVAEVAEAELELVPAAEPELAEVAEPEAEAPELDAAPLDEADADLGLTMEWDNELPPLEPEEEYHEAEPEPGSVLTGGTKVRRTAPRPLVILLPLLLVVAIAAGAAAVAGVFSGDTSTPAISKPPAPHVQAPVTTPLPIRIRHRPAASTATPSTTAATGTSTGATSGTAASDGTASTTVP